MGIKHADNESLPVTRGFYAIVRPNWRLLWQVSGHFHSGAKQTSLPSLQHSRRRQKHSEMPSAWVSRSKRHTRTLRRAIVCAGKMSRAAESPMCGRSKICRRKLWRRGCNVTGWTSAGICWPALKPDERGSRTGCFPISSAPWAFPSPGFSPRKFETSTPNLPPAPLPVRPKSRSGNAKS